MVDLDNIKTTFAFFDDWEDKYRFLIDLGKSVPVLSSEFRIAENLVRGCQSQVWLLGEYDAEQHRLRLQIDSDAHIVRGLIAIVLATFDERSPNEIVDYDIEHLFKELDLLNHLSVTRGNGLRALVKRINDTASSYLKNCPAPRILDTVYIYSFLRSRCPPKSTCIFAQTTAICRSGYPSTIGTPSKGATSQSPPSTIEIRSRRAKSNFC